MSKSISEASWSIAAVERETGLSKDILRMWERRYGFPAPARDTQGDRLYSTAEVGRLRMMAKLIEQGHRPGRLMQVDDIGLETLLAEPPQHGRKRAAGSDPEALGEMLAGHRLQDLRRWLEERCASVGRPALALSLLGIAESLRSRFLNGELSAFEMDLFATEALRVVHNEPVAGPGVVLVAADGELGYLELRLLQTIIAAAGCACILLPHAEKRLASLQRLLRDGRPAALCLAFSPATRPRRIASVLDGLRPVIPPEISLLVTLAGTSRPPAVASALCVPAGELAGEIVHALRQTSS